MNFSEPPGPAAIRRDIVVIGASAGGVRALRRLVPALPTDFDAAVLIVLHIGAHASTLPQILAIGSRLPISHAIHGEPLAKGRVYVAPPDHHLLLEDGHLLLTRGPKEHHTRPAIDPLFRTAAIAHGPRTIAVVLSGLLDDGSAGAQAVKECGGVVVVQDPADAAEPSMPLSVMRHVAVDHCVALDRIAGTLCDLVGTPAPAPAPLPPARLLHEDAIAWPDGNPMENLAAIATPSTFTCPDCHGALWELSNSKPLRYRCHTGHGFSLRSLQHAQNSAIDEALWAGLRALQEKEFLQRREAASEREAGDEASALRLDAKADRLAVQVSALRKLVEQP